MQAPFMPKLAKRGNFQRHVGGIMLPYASAEMLNPVNYLIVYSTIRTIIFLLLLSFCNLFS